MWQANQPTAPTEGEIMGKIAVHEFITLDGVIEDPRWTMDYPFDPKMGQAIGGIMGASKGLLLGRRTYEMFAPAWSTRTAEEDPGAPFMNDTMKYVVSEHPVERRLEQLGDRRPVQRAGDPRPEGAHRWRYLRERQRHAGPGHAGRRPGRRASPVRVPARARHRAATVPRGWRSGQAGIWADPRPTTAAWSTSPTCRRRSESGGRVSRRA